MILESESCIVEFLREVGSIYRIWKEDILHNASVEPFITDSIVELQLAQIALRPGQNIVDHFCSEIEISYERHLIMWDS